MPLAFKLLSICQSAPLELTPSEEALWLFPSTGEIDIPGRLSQGGWSTSEAMLRPEEGETIPMTAVPGMSRHKAIKLGYRLKCPWLIRLLPGGEREVVYTGLNERYRGG